MKDKIVRKVIVGIIFSLIFIIFIIKLPSPTGRILTFIGAVIFFSYPVVKEYLYDREIKSKSSKIKKTLGKIKGSEKLEKILKVENNELLSSIGFIKKSLLLKASDGGFYQCIKGENKLYFVYIGNELNDVKTDLMKTEFWNEETFINKEKDYALNKKEISFIKYKADRDFIDQPSIYNTSITIECKSLKNRYKVLGEVNLEELEAFFSGIKINTKFKNINYQIEDSSSPQNKKNNNKMLISRLKLIFTILTVTSIVVTAAFLFIIVNYKLMSILSIALFITIFILYIKYNDILSLEDEKRNYTRGKINITYAIFIPCIGLTLRSLMDFNLLSYKVFIIMSIIVFLAILFAFFWFTNEYQSKKSSIGIIVAAALLFAPSAVVQVNYIFDYSDSVIIQSPIYDMRISKGSKAPDRYIVKVTLSDNKKIELNVSEEYYKRHAIGDMVDIVERQGFLKIPHAYVKNNSKYR